VTQTAGDRRAAAPVELDIDLAASVLCAVEPCVVPPSWRGRSVCEPRHDWLPCCTPHRLLIESENARSAAQVADICCVVCHAPLAPPYVEWRPL